MKKTFLMAAIAAATMVGSGAGLESFQPLN